MKEYYQRNLPHYQPKNAVLFMTVRLHGSMPKERLQELAIAKKSEETRLMKLGLSEKELKEAIAKNHDLYFGKFDDLLDNSTTGPHWLKEEGIAKIWNNALNYFNDDRYKIICSTIMSNHVHFIFYKLDRSLAQVMKTMKGYSSYEANKVLVNKTSNKIKGTPFWQDESYDRAIRNRRELQIKINYVLNNPVKAGVVRYWKDWKWNYIHPQFLKYIM